MPHEVQGHRPASSPWRPPQKQKTRFPVSARWLAQQRNHPHCVSLRLLENFAYLLHECGHGSRGSILVLPSCTSWCFGAPDNLGNPSSCQSVNSWTWWHSKIHRLEIRTKSMLHWLIMWVGIPIMWTWTSTPLKDTWNESAVTSEIHGCLRWESDWRGRLSVQQHDDQSKGNPHEGTYLDQSCDQGVCVPAFIQTPTHRCTMSVWLQSSWAYWHSTTLPRTFSRDDKLSFDMHSSWQHLVFMSEKSSSSTRAPLPYQSSLRILSMMLSSFYLLLSRFTTWLCISLSLSPMSMTSHLQFLFGTRLVAVTLLDLSTEISSWNFFICLIDTILCFNFFPFCPSDIFIVSVDDFEVISWMNSTTCLTQIIPFTITTHHTHKSFSHVSHFALTFFNSFSDWELPLLFPSVSWTFCHRRQLLSQLWIDIYDCPHDVCQIRPQQNDTEITSIYNVRIRLQWICPNSFNADSSSARKQCPQSVRKIDTSVLGMTTLSQWSCAKSSSTVAAGFLSPASSS